MKIKTLLFKKLLCPFNPILYEVFFYMEWKIYNVDAGHMTNPARKLLAWNQWNDFNETW